MIKLIRFLLGYVIFEGICPAPERFMNLIAKEGLNIWDIRSSKNKISGCIKISEYRYLKPIIYKTRSKIKIKEKHGLVFKLRPYKKRYGLFLGAVIFILILNCLSVFIWVIKIDEDSLIPKEEVYSALNEIGIYTGVRGKSIDSQIVEQQLMNKLTDISWIAVNINGSVVNVEINDRVKSPEIYTPQANSNLVASRPGQITRLEIYNGIALVKPGDVVVSDQILVSGVFEDDLGGVTLKQSVGKVYANTLRELQQEIPLKKEFITQNAPSVERKSINFFGINIPISLTTIPDSDYQLDTNIFQAELFGSKLPIYLHKETFTPIDRSFTVLTCDQAEVLAEESLKLQEEDVFKNSNIINKNVKYQINGDTYILIADYLCEENIAVEKAFDIEIDPKNNISESESA